MWIRGETKGRMGEGVEKRRKKERARAINTRWGQSQTVGQTDRQIKEKKGGWEGGESQERSTVQSRSRRHQAGGWRPRAGCAEAEGTPGLRRGTHHGSARGRVRGSGGRDQARRRLPPAASVSPGLAGGQLRPRWRLGPLGLPGRGAPQGRAETAAPPRPALQCPPPPPHGTPCRDSLSRAEPLRRPSDAPAGLPRSPATLFLLRPALQWVVPTLTLGCPPRRGCPSFPASASLPAGSV